MLKAIVAVTNDLTTDQRVDRTCMTLVGLGYDVTLVGRTRPGSLPLSPRPYRMYRMKVWFDKGPLFYASYNLALFFFLLTHTANLLITNDLDTLAGGYAAWRIKKDHNRTIHLHDCHEYFRGVPELNNRKTVSRIWKWIEDRIFPKLRHVIAVNGSVADLYAKEYGNAISVVRNMPYRKQDCSAGDRKLLRTGENQRVILYQGAVNVDRGLEESILAMKYVKTDSILVIAGIGDIYHRLVQMTQDEGLVDKVTFLGQVPFQELHGYTCMADLGLSVEKDVSINYHYCLPNKFLDYIQAQVPVLVSPLPEMKALVEQYRIGEFLGDHDPVKFARQIDDLLNDKEKLEDYRENLKQAAADLCWENEAARLVSLIRPVTT